MTTSFTRAIAISASTLYLPTSTMRVCVSSSPENSTSGKQRTRDAQTRDPRVVP